MAELDTENRKLRESKYDLDSKVRIEQRSLPNQHRGIGICFLTYAANLFFQVSELSHKLGSAEGSNRSLEEESTRLKQQNQQLSSDKHEREIQLNEAKAKLIALDEKVSSSWACTLPILSFVCLKGRLAGAPGLVL